MKTFRQFLKEDLTYLIAKGEGKSISIFNGKDFSEYKSHKFPSNGLIFDTKEEAHKVLGKLDDKDAYIDLVKKYVSEA
jgi:hypothetical protein